MTPQTIIGKFTWPLIMLDFEASALDEGSYPIEVGITLWNAPEDQVKGWSSLIQPHKQWTQYGIWSKNSQNIHKITPEELQQGQTPTQVIATLNEIIKNGTAYCDGGKYDRNWLEILSRGSDIKPRWRLGDYHHLCQAMPFDSREKTIDYLARNKPPHRARPDAEILMNAIRVALGYNAVTSADITL